MADNLLFELSSTTQLDGEPFTRRDVLYVVDSNNGSYQGVNQLIYDTASLANSGRWCSYSEAFLEIPLTICVSSSGKIDDALGADFLAGLKNGYYQIINSMSVEMNNTSIIQQTNFSNAHISYRMMTQASQGDIKLNGATIGFAPDNAGSWTYDATRGSQNNVITPALLDTNVSNVTATYNDGYTARTTAQSFDTGKTGYSLLHETSDIDKFNKSYASASTNNGAGLNYKSWFINAIIRLKDIHPFFGNGLPLTKGSYFKFYINLNQSITTLTTTGGTWNLSPSNINIFGGGTNPLMVSQVGAGAIPPSVEADATYKFSVSVIKPIDSQQASLQGTTNPFQTSTRLYVPAYSMNPAREKSYLEQNRTKTIKYNDIYQYQFQNIGSSFNILVSNGISKLKQLVIIPLLNKASNGNVGANGGFTPIASPFASEPATTSPVAWFRDFNVQISGVNAFVNNLQYGYEQFLTELQNTGVNGNLTTGLCSGLISKADFENQYSYYVVDCSRRLGQAFLAPASVQLVGTTAMKSGVAMDILTFCEFEREITIDTFTGDIIGA